MALNTWFGWKVDTTSTELPVIFPLSIAKNDFIDTDVQNIYQKILTDVLERTQGIESVEHLLWDNCLQSENAAGLVSMLAKAMSLKNDLFLVYDKAIEVLRIATSDEQAKIREDYKQRGESPIGVYISFRKYLRTDMIKLYSALEYYTIASLNKQANLSAAIQFKMNDLRGSTSLTDKAEVKAQALLIAQGLSNGHDVLLDGKDVIETATPQLDAINQSIEFLNQKRAFYLGLPASYITGIPPKGLGDSGEGDQKAVERGLKGYFFAIIKPVMQVIFGIDASYKSQDFRMIAQALSALQTFSIVEEDLISLEQKKLVINKLLDFEDEEVDQV